VREMLFVLIIVLGAGIWLGIKYGARISASWKKLKDLFKETKETEIETGTEKETEQVVISSRDIAIKMAIFFSIWVVLFVFAMFGAQIVSWIAGMHGGNILDILGRMLAWLLVVAIDIAIWIAWIGWPFYLIYRYLKRNKQNKKEQP